MTRVLRVPMNERLEADLSTVREMYGATSDAETVRRVMYEKSREIRQAEGQVKSP